MYVYSPLRQKREIKQNMKQNKYEIKCPKNKTEYE